METKKPGTTANRWAGYLLVAIALLHTAFFAPHPYWAQWLSGGLRDGTAKTDSFAVFWALPGSFVVVMILLGLLIARMARLGQHVPGYLGWGIAAWCVVCVGLIGPSGFLTGLAPAALLIGANVAARRAARRADDSPVPSPDRPTQLAEH